MTDRICRAIAVMPLVASFLGSAEPDVDFNRDIRPILSNKCYACHGPDEKERKGKLRLDNFDGATKSSAAVPGDPAKSELLHRVSSKNADEVMPPPKSGKTISQAERTTLERWIRQGAKYATHWSYAKPVRPAVPAITNPPWPISNAIDAHLLAKLAGSKLKPNPLADKETLIRRVSLDLIGLPPTIAEIDEFLKDDNPEAYERLVDRLLKKPSFGEHWARLWLDLARYADSAGYADDGPRTIWPFRDYVIDSLNANKPFDAFTIEQLAGDLLPNATNETRTATAFHRNTMTNSEGGTSDEEFRNVAVVDRVNTTFAVWMGTSLACAQCHTHKYDPISQKEYFQLFAFFNQTADDDQSNESPTLVLDDSDEKKTKRAELRQQLDAAQKEKPEKDDAKKDRQKRIDDLNKQIAALVPKATVPVFEELPKERRRITKVQRRGNFQDLGETVTEATPSAFVPLPKGEPLNRLTLARWIASPDNPLTARVTVNRFWEQIFGQGLVRTTEEFGTQGDLPTHPELLDWLAVEFAAKWDVKHILKLMVTSSAYKQRSTVTPEAWSEDPENRLLARGARHRLGAETIRDQALFAAGLLSSKMKGPSVRPVRPNAGLTAAFGGGLDWQASSGEDRHRRGLYTEWRRTSPYPSMSTFDAPSRETCTLRRNRTNTPLQALVTLNDPVYVEASQALGRRVVANGKSFEDRLEFAFRCCLARRPTAKESERLKQLYYDVATDLKKDAKKAEALATDPIGPLPKGGDAVELATWTALGNVLLNLDEFLMRR